MKMRIRTVKPEFFQDAGLAQLGPYDRLLYQGLWLLADREGRLEDDPVLIKAQLFPREPKVDVAGGLSRLTERGYLLRYVVEDVAVILVRTFTKHQVINSREAGSVLPEPRVVDTHVHARETHVHAQGELERERELEGKKTSPPAVGVSPLDGFAEFWTAYPRKVDKGDAERAWRKLKPDRALRDRMFATLRVQTRGWTDPQFIPYPASWLNGRRWEDEVGTGPPKRRFPTDAELEAIRADIGVRLPA